MFSMSGAPIKPLLSEPKALKVVSIPSVEDVEPSVDILGSGHCFFLVGI